MPLIATNGRKEMGRNNNITQIDPSLNIRRLFQQNRRNLVVGARSGESRFTHPLQTSSIVQCEAAAR